MYFLDNYAVARRKLKDAEIISDGNSGTEIERNLKKSRKIRAAKVFDESSNDELSDDMILMSDIPKFPSKRSTTTESTQPFKNKNSQIGKRSKVMIIDKLN